MILRRETTADTMMPSKIATESWPVTYLATTSAILVMMRCQMVPAFLFFFMA